MSRKRGKRLTHITTECGHQFRTNYPARTLAGATIDCLHCDSLLIFRRDARGTAVRAYLFHREMNRTDPRWPADGTDTYRIGF